MVFHLPSFPQDQHIASNSVDASAGISNDIRAQKGALIVIKGPANCDAYGYLHSYWALLFAKEATLWCQGPLHGVYMLSLICMDFCLLGFG